MNKNAEEIKNLIEEIMTYLPTDLKYNKHVETFLLNTLGHSFTTEEDEERYEQLETNILEEQIYNAIPSYIREEDITVWEAEKALYDEEIKDAYPEAYSKEASKLYTLIKKA